MARWSVVGQGDYVFIWLYGGKQRQLVELLADVGRVVGV